MNKSIAIGCLIALAAVSAPLRRRNRQGSPFPARSPSTGQAPIPEMIVYLESLDPTDAAARFGVPARRRDLAEGRSVLPRRR